MRHAACGNDSGAPQRCTDVRNYRMPGSTVSVFTGSTCRPSMILNLLLALKPSSLQQYSIQTQSSAPTGRYETQRDVHPISRDPSHPDIASQHLQSNSAVIVHISAESQKMQTFAPGIFKGKVVFVTGGEPQILPLSRPRHSTSGSLLIFKAVQGYVTP